MSAQNIFLIVHGACGHPQENWFGWLKDRLTERGGKVLAPQFPTPDGQSFTAWKKIADQALAEHAPEQTVLIGHSSGAAFVLRMAELAQKPYKAIFAACPFMRALGLAEFDPLNESFVHPEPDWMNVRRGAGKIVCFAGDDDPYVPLEFSRDAAAKAGAEFVPVVKGGHLNTKAGFAQFPLLLEKISPLSA